MALLTSLTLLYNGMTTVIEGGNTLLFNNQLSCSSPPHHYLDLIHNLNHVNLFLLASNKLFIILEWHTSMKADDFHKSSALK